MQTLQIRLTKGQIKQLDHLIKNGVYANRCEAIRHMIVSHLSKQWNLR